MEHLGFGAVGFKVRGILMVGLGVGIRFSGFRGGGGGRGGGVGVSEILKVLWKAYDLGLPDAVLLKGSGDRVNK